MLECLVKSLYRPLTVSRVIVIAAAVFISGSKRFVKTPPHGSAVIDAVKIVSIAVKEGGFENARPSALQARGALERHRFAGSPSFTDKAVKDVQSGITACKVCVEPQNGVGAYGI
jgi:POT family proton-dependent oligopeptide transporter